MTSRPRSTKGTATVRKTMCNSGIYYKSWQVVFIST